MSYNIFGFEIRKAAINPALTSPTTNDGAVEHDVSGSSAGAYGVYLDLNKRIVNEVDLINKYRAMANYPEIDNAIEDIVDEAIVSEDDKAPVSINFRTMGDEIPLNIQQLISAEFETILSLYDFRAEGHDIFRQWYVDGRYYSQIIVDETNLKLGIQEIRNLDPRKTKKVRELTKTKGPGGVDVVTDVQEYFIYGDTGTANTSTGVKLSPDTIIHATSGRTDEYGNTVSYLNKCIKPSNQLRYMEDAALIYTLSRAPSRRVFYIDIADMPKQKADQYMQNIMTKFKNKVIYNNSTGEISDDRVHQTLMDDYWLPRRSGGRSTEIQQLPSENITGQIENIMYFLNKVYGALNIPQSRVKQDAGFSLGRSQEITRDELKFSKFIDRLRNKFSDIFLQALRVQLVLKGIITPEDWDFIKSRIAFDYQRDNYFTELKESEILTNLPQHMYNHSF